MNHFLKGITFSYHRNIGWQDKAIRTVLGLTAAFGAYYFSNSNTTYSVLFAILAAAQALTVFTSKCIICYYSGICTITKAEKHQLDRLGVLHE